MHDSYNTGDQSQKRPTEPDVFSVAVEWLYKNNHYSMDIDNINQISHS